MDGLVTDIQVRCDVLKYGWRWHLTGVEHRNGSFFVVFWDRHVATGALGWYRGPGAGYGERDAKLNGGG